MKRTSTILIFMILLLLTCAKMGFPPGGPEDKTPPRIVASVPEVGETQVNPGTLVQVIFSEYIKPLNAADAIFISPYPGDDVKYTIRGKKITVRFDQSLRENKTYVITFGTGIRDYRNNALKETFTLAFSTGDSLDKGEIAGRIFGVDDATGIDIWAYGLVDSQSLDPAILRPDYIVQCEKDGKFRFTHLSEDRYRLFAVRDRAADRLYQPVEDGVGLACRDVLLSREGSLYADSLFFRMTSEDTLGPTLVKAVSLNRQLVHLQFDEAVSSMFNRDFFTIVSAEDSLDTLFVHHVYFDGRNRRMLQIRTEPQNPAVQYRLRTAGITDEYGNASDSVVRFSGNAQTDTTMPRLIKAVPAPGEKTVPLEGMIQLTFSEAMDTAQFRQEFTFSDTLGVPAGGLIYWLSPLEMIFQSSVPLESKKYYQIRLGNLMDLAGNAMPDTLFRFQTLDGDTLTEILGNVIDSDTSGSGDIYISVYPVKEKTVLSTIKISKPGSYRIGALLPGHYFLDCFRDTDGNGRYSYGCTFPFIPAERFAVYPDTVVLRSRWPNEGNDIILP